VRGCVAITPIGLIGKADADGWTVPPAASSAGLWLAFVRQLTRRPARLMGSVIALLRPAVRRPRDALVALRATLSVCYLAERENPDLLHAQFGGPAAAGAFIWHRLADTPYTVRAHAYDIYRPYAWLGVVLRNSAGVLSISEHGAVCLERNWGIASRVIRVGVPTDAVPERGNHPAAHPPRFVSVGALAPKKGHDILIEAVNRLKRSPDRVLLDIYGDGPLRDALLRQADPEVVRLVGAGSSSAVRDAYRTYDGFALACRIADDGDMDGIPVVLMEASLAGLPIVTTSVAGIPELIQHKQSGWAGEATVDDVIEGLVWTTRDYAAARMRAGLSRARVTSLHDLDERAADLCSVWLDKRHLMDK
jgi:glycosyltransferase involved in cell wall biosynthesis